MPGVGDQIQTRARSWKRRMEQTEHQQAEMAKRLKPAEQA